MYNLFRRKVTEGFFNTHDRTQLFYRAWEPHTSSSGKKRALIVIHRGHEHSGRLHELIAQLGLNDYYAFGFDARGHGLSPGPRGYAPDLSDCIQDLETFVKFISQTYGISEEDMAVVANSVGAVIASAWVHDYAPRIRCMVLAAPAFKVKLYVPFALPGLRLLNLLKNPSFISSYVKPRFLTHDPIQQRMYREDKLITPQIAVNILVDLFDTAQRIVEDAAAIQVPTFVMSAGSDFVVDGRPQKVFFDKLSSPTKKWQEYPGFFHGLLYEKDRQIPLAEAREFISSCFESRDLVPAVETRPTAFSQKEYETLTHGQPSFLNALSYALQKLGMVTLGKLSKGIRIGFESGFDSGISLDHVYKNRAMGTTFLGKIIDFFYINAIGWRGIRQRKLNLQSMIEEAIRTLQSKNEKIRIMDIAAGAGRYLIEVAKKYENQGLEVLIRDHDVRNIEEAKEIASSLQCKNVFFQIADAFDPKSYLESYPASGLPLDWRPNILVISGLYELFPDNEIVLRSLKAAGAQVEPQGILIYTGQPWHPQLEMIAKTLPNREGKPWIMRRRSQLELDNLVRSTQFKKLDSKIDRWGIFTVSMAQK